MYNGSRFKGIIIHVLNIGHNNQAAKADFMLNPDLIDIVFLSTDLYARDEPYT